MLERGEGLLGRGEGMLGRGVPRPVRRFGPLALAFLAGYLLKLLDTPREHLSGLENVRFLTALPWLGRMVNEPVVRRTCRCSWARASPCWCWSSPPPPTPW